nr:CcdB family protein [Thioalkalivibrio sp. AKL17]
MAQFSVHRNPSADTASWAPYLLVLQNDLLSELSTVVVAPLIHVGGQPPGRSARTWHRIGL